MGPRRSRRSKSPGCTTPQEMYCNVTDIRGLDAENASRENLLEMNWDTSSGLPGAYMGKSNVDPLDLMSATFPGVAGPERAHAAGDLADELAELKLATGDGNVAGEGRRPGTIQGAAHLRGDAFRAPNGVSMSHGKNDSSLLPRRKRPSTSAVICSPGGMSPTSPSTHGGGVAESQFGPPAKSNTRKQQAAKTLGNDATGGNLGAWRTHTASPALSITEFSPFTGVPATDMNHVPPSSRFRRASHHGSHSSNLSGWFETSPYANEASISNDRAASPNTQARIGHPPTGLATGEAARGKTLTSSPNGAGMSPGVRDSSNTTAPTSAAATTVRTQQQHPATAPGGQRASTVDSKSVPATARAAPRGFLSPLLQIQPSAIPATWVSADSDKTPKTQLDCAQSTTETVTASPKLDLARDKREVVRLQREADAMRKERHSFLKRALQASYLQSAKDEKDERWKKAFVRRSEEEERRRASAMRVAEHRDAVRDRKLARSGTRAGGGGGARVLEEGGSANEGVVVGCPDDPPGNHHGLPKPDQGSGFGEPSTAEEAAAGTRDRRFLSTASDAKANDPPQASGGRDSRTKAQRADSQTVFKDFTSFLPAKSGAFALRLAADTTGTSLSRAGMPSSPTSPFSPATATPCNRAFFKLRASSSSGIPGVVGSSHRRPDVPAVTAMPSNPRPMTVSSMARPHEGGAGSHGQAGAAERVVPTGLQSRPKGADNTTDIHPSQPVRKGPLGKTLRARQHPGAVDIRVSDGASNMVAESMVAFQPLSVALQLHVPPRQAAPTAARRAHRQNPAVASQNAASERRSSAGLCCATEGSDAG